MQLIPQHICTLTAPMAIINRKQTALRPITHAPFILWFADVQNYGDSVLVVGADVPVVGVGSVRVEQSVLLRGVAGGEDFRNAKGRLAFGGHCDGKGIDF